MHRTFKYLITIKHAIDYHHVATISLQMFYKVSYLIIVDERNTKKHKKTHRVERNRFVWRISAYKNDTTRINKDKQSNIVDAQSILVVPRGILLPAR